MAKKPASRKEAASKTSAPPLDASHYNQALLRGGVGSRFWESDLSRSRVQKDIEAWMSNNGEHFSKGVGLFFIGPRGTGKTSTMVAVVKEILSRRIVRVSETQEFAHFSLDWQYISTNQLFTAFVKDKDWVLAAKNRHLLLIDDWGREYRHDFGLSEFEDFIDYRYAHQLVTFISTNMKPDVLQHIEYQFIVDRLKEMCVFLRVGGESMRRQV